MSARRQRRRYDIPVTLSDGTTAHVHTTMRQPPSPEDVAAFGAMADAAFRLLDARERDPRIRYAEHIDREATQALVDTAWRSTRRHVRQGETTQQRAWQERYSDVAALYVDLGGEG